MTKFCGIFKKGELTGNSKYKIVYLEKDLERAEKAIHDMRVFEAWLYNISYADADKEFELLEVKPSQIKDNYVYFDAVTCEYKKANEYNRTLKLKQGEIK